jgi:hypothetical protein
MSIGSALLDLIASYNSKLIMKPLTYWYESFDRGVPVCRKASVCRGQHKK